jgi:hypothetical protein
LNPAAVVTLYMRPDCHLCEEARLLIAELRAEGHVFSLREVNIDEDDALHAAFLERIPVIEVSGSIISELEPDVAALRARLDTVRG